jgi:hypothetical protein
MENSWKSIIEWESDENPINVEDSPDAMIGFINQFDGEDFGHSDLDEFTAVIRVIDTEAEDGSKIVTVHEVLESKVKPVVRLRGSQPEIAKEQVKSIAEAYKNGMDSVKELIHRHTESEKVDTLTELFNVDVERVEVDDEYRVIFVSDRMNSDSLTYLSSGTPTYEVTPENDMLRVRCSSPILL